MLIALAVFITAAALNIKQDYELTYEMPAEPASLPSDLEEAQQLMEELTWQRFIAINWPADGDQPKPNTDQNIPSGNSYQTVWNNYGLNYDLYLLPDGTTPVPLSDVAGKRAQRKERWIKDCPNVLADGDAPTDYIILDEFIEASLAPNDPHHPLIDQNGEYVRTSVMYNDVLYDFVQGEGLYTYSGMLDYLNTAGLTPFQSTTTGNTTSQQYRVAIPNESQMLKTSWKVLGEGDDPSKFFTKDVVFIFENMNIEGNDFPVTCDILKVGLVGFHFTIKTEQQQSWVWSTFEHVDNVPDLNDEDPSGHYNFFDMASLSDDPLINKPSGPTDTTSFFKKNPYWYNPFTKGQKPNHIMREIPIGPETQALNKKYQEKLENTVWKNYQLVGSQWAYDYNQFTPQLLSNSTLESYEQPQASCMGCHNLLSGNGNNSLQQALGNTPNLYAPLLSATDTVDGKYYKKTLHADWMWSSFKIYPVGQLSWEQVRQLK